VQTVVGEQTMCRVLMLSSGDNTVLSKAFSYFKMRSLFHSDSCQGLMIMLCEFCERIGQNCRRLRPPRCALGFSSFRPSHSPIGQHHVELRGAIRGYAIPPWRVDTITVFRSTYGRLEPPALYPALAQPLPRPRLPLTRGGMLCPSPSNNSPPSRWARVRVEGGAVLLPPIPTSAAGGKGCFPPPVSRERENNHYSASSMLNGGERHEASDEGSGMDCAILNVS
jgi:hypothetical protein